MSDALGAVLRAALPWSREATLTTHPGKGTLYRTCTPKSAPWPGLHEPPRFHPRSPADPVTVKALDFSGVWRRGYQCVTHEIANRVLDT